MLPKAEDALQALGLPARDAYRLPSSSLRFPDGCHWRVEISGVERLSTLEALLEESERQQIPVHRIIAMVMGATYLVPEELREFARLARDAGIEVIVTPGPRPLWDAGKQVATPEGALSGLRLRGADGLCQYVADVMRAVDVGFRGFLVWDEGCLSVMNRLRQEVHLPENVVFKVSIFAGHANPAGARLLEELGADTFNPVADLTLPQLAALRQAVRIPMDIHVILFDSFGGHNRMYECPELARIAAPCYFKIEPGPSVSTFYKPWAAPETHRFVIREKVKMARIIRDIVVETCGGIKCSPAAPADLAIPEP